MAKLAIAVWNCNGALWLDPIGFMETYSGQDIMFYTETHESLERGLPNVTGFIWESAHKIETKRDNGIHGS